MTLRLILGDQLNTNHSWFSEVRDDVHYCMFEMRQETDYCLHHAQKVIGFFGAMRRFADALSNAGHTFTYFKINDPDNTQSLTGNISLLVERLGATRFEWMQPDEYRLDVQLKDFAASLTVPFQMHDTEHFLTERMETAAIFEGKKTWLMETFYRKMRMKHQLLMQPDGQPEGGQWNFDHDNRSKWTGKPPLPPALHFENNCAELWQEIEASGAKTFGNPCAAKYEWPLDRSQCLSLLDYFCRVLLPHFGTYEDAMTTHSHTLFHSRLSFAMNTKMLSPLEVVHAAIAAWRAQPALITLAQVEGFVRQIIGWREYMRGVYWAHMPEFGTRNFFGNTRKLPTWFWTGDTKMNCLKHAIGQSLEHAYAHHIQRLMVTGNFAALAGIDPDETDAWYLGIYIDALDWVEITNTRGMSQFADGGLVGTKPYVASANYIHKMSDYCGRCQYDRNLRHGPKACPLNSLYWHFYERNRHLLAKNPRIGMAYVTLDKMLPEEKALTMRQAELYLERLDEL